MILARRQHLKLLLGISAVALVATAAADYALYRRSVNATLTQLELVVQFHLRLIDSMGHFHAGHVDPNNPDAVFRATVQQLREAYQDYPSIGSSGELAFGYSNLGTLHFITRSGRGSKGPEAVLDPSLERAEPMKRALAGQSGTIIAPDYRGVPVLAAFAPVPRLHLGVVAKIDRSEVLAPYLIGGALAGALIVLCVFLGALPMLRSIAPLLRRLEQSQDFSRSIVETAPEGIVTFDANGRVLSANPAAERLFGYSKQELLSLNVSRLVPGLATPADASAEHTPPGDSQPVGAHAMRTATGHRKDGGTIPLELTIGTGSLDGRALRTAYVRDVTARVEAEDALRANRRLLQTVFDTIPYPIYLKSVDARYLMVNRTMAAHHGLSPEELVGKRIQDLPYRTPDEAHQISELDRLVLERGEVIDFAEVQAHLADGQEQWQRLLKVPYRDKQGDVAGLIGMAIDITPRKRAEDEVRTSQRLLQAVFETIPFPLTVKDRDSRYLMANNAWLHIHGMTSGQALQRTAMEITSRPLEDRQHAVELDQEVLRSGGALVVREIQRSTANRGLRQFRTHKTGLSDEQGRLIGIVTMDVDITDARHQEQALRDSQRFLRGVIDTIPHTLVMKDREGHYAMVNRAWLEFYGLREEQVVGAHTLELPGRPQEDLRDALAADRAVFESGKPRAAEMVRTTGSGQRRVLQDIRVPLLDERGQAMGLVALAMDVTERRQAEEALRASEERFRNLIEGSVQGVLIVRDFKPIFANKAYAELFGYASPEDVLERWSFEGTFPEHERARMQSYQQARMRGESAPTQYEVQAMRLDDTPIWLETSARRINWNGEVATQITTHDVTERKLTEEALRASEERFRSLIESSLQGIILYRNDKAYFANRALARIFGFDSPEEILALTSLQDLIDPADRAALDELHGVVGRSGAPADAPFQLSGLRRDGRKVRLQALIQRIDWQGRRVFQATLTDVSDRALLEDQLRQAQKMEAVGQLAGGVAHDFNNILQIMRGYTELAHHKTKDGPVGGYLERVLKAADGASHLVRQLLALSRREILRPRNLELNRLITDLMQVLQRLIGEDIELTLHTRAEPSVILGDAAMLEQVLLNLCVNARDAMPDGGELTIETGRLHADAEFSRLHGWCRQGPYVAICVSDTGMGISAEDCVHVFEPFFTTKEAGKGTGLGLSMAYGIVQQHRGLMDVESTPGQGATFRIYLPAVGEQPDAQEEWVVDEPRGGNETVLVAEDEPGVLQLVVQLLEQRGYRVLRASDGDEAVRVFERHCDEIDLAMLDVVMPKQSGRAVYTVLQARRPDLPVLFSTGYAADALDAEFVREHRFHIVRKPYSPNTLYQAVRNALDSPWPPARSVDSSDEERNGTSAAS